MHSLYESELIERAQHPLFRGQLEHATHRADGANLSCGDEIHWDVVVDGGVVREICHSGRSCSVCTASADLISELVQGRALGDVAAMNTQTVTDMIGIPLSPIRLKCALLPLEALKNLEEA